MKTIDAYQPKGYKTAAKNIAPSDTTTKLTLLTSGADDSVIKSILATSTDTSDRVIQFFVNNGSIDVLAFSVKVPAGAGTDGVIPAVDCLADSGLPLDGVSKKVLPIQATFLLKIAMLVTITATKSVGVVATVQDY